MTQENDPSFLKKLIGGAEGKTTRKPSAPRYRKEEEELPKKTDAKTPPYLNSEASELRRMINRQSLLNWKITNDPDLTPEEIRDLKEEVLKIGGDITKKAAGKK